MTLDAETLLDELNAVDEHERIEAKRGTEAGKAVMRAVVAFANEPRLDGGYILFGVQRRDIDTGARYEVVGVPDPDKVSRDFASQCATMLNQKNSSSGDDGDGRGKTRRCRVRPRGAAS